MLAIVPMFAGFIPVLFTERRRGLPDFRAGTVVLYDENGRVTKAETEDRSATAARLPPSSRETTVR